MNLNIDMNLSSDFEKMQFYVNRSHPVINKRALFADGTPFYRSFTKNGDTYQAHLKFRTGRNNVEYVAVIVDEQAYEMTKSISDPLFDYYECTLACPASGMNYFFHIQSGRIRLYYNKRGVMDEIQNYYNYKLLPEFKTPDWAKGAVFYQIFVDRFRNGDPSNDVMDREYAYIHVQAEAVADWNSMPKPMDVARFYGGDLQGVLDKLDYLKDLGIDAIYLNPIFVSPSNHKYDIQDYDYVDPHYGKIMNDGGQTLAPGNVDNSQAARYITRVTNKQNLEASNAFFIKLVEEIHRRGMKVILDGVFNHCGSFNKWMDRERIYEHQAAYADGAYISRHSPYHSFFKFNEQTNWPYNSHYDGWWGHDTLPKLNYEESAELESYILKIAEKWVSPPFNADGWRLDVAADLGHSSEYNHKFWGRFRKAVKKANPNAIIMAEHYGDPAVWLQGDEWDTVMNYDAFMEPVTWFLTGVEKHSDEYREDLLGNPETFFSAMSHHMSRFHSESLYVAMNELSNHDHSRFLTRTNHQVGRLASVGAASASEGVDKALMRCGVVIQMTWPGAPTVYYGDEAGLCGWTDPDSRRAYPWGQEDQELIAFHKEIIRLHKAYEALKTGSLMFLCGQPNLIVYGRFNQNERLFVVVNNHPDQPKEVVIPVWRIGIGSGERIVRQLLTEGSGYIVEPEEMIAVSGCVTMSVLPRSAALYAAKAADKQNR